MNNSARTLYKCHQLLMVCCASSSFSYDASSTCLALKAAKQARVVVGAERDRERRGEGGVVHQHINRQQSVRLRPYYS